MSQNDQTGRPCLFPSGIRSVQLYWSPEVLAADAARCTELGWHQITLDAGHWADADTAHEALAQALGFPSYYGRNLDALDDAMAGVAEGRYGFASDVPGGLLVVSGIDRLMGAQPRLAAVLVEVLSETASRALRFGWPLACFLQSDDPEIRLGPLLSQPVPWNRQERSPANRRS